MALGNRRCEYCGEWLEEFESGPLCNTCAEQDWRERVQEEQRRQSNGG